MRVGVIQSCFIPWRGYFDFVRSVDLFVIYDDVQYSKNGWRNRNRIKTSAGSRWITVPVRHRSLSQLICDTEIDDRNDWRATHIRLWDENYSTTPYYQDVLALLGSLGRGGVNTISELNIGLTKAIAAYLGVGTDLILSSELNLGGTKTDRLIELLSKVGATTYLSGPSADAYLDKDTFRRAGIRLEYKSYDYEPYPQQWGAFDGAVTVLDLIANCGPESVHYLHSRTPDVSVI
jgi:hypothetical protein